MGRSPCCDKNGLKKGPWTQEEDQKLIDYIQKHGYGHWRTLPKNAGLQRCGKSCRLRWTNYLRPDIKRGEFSFEEEETIIHLHSIIGNKWSAIAARLPGRTDNEIKNYWNTHIRKRLLRMGIDPVTHAPRLDILDLAGMLSYSSSVNPVHQINFSRLLGVDQTNLISPQLLRFANDFIQMNNCNENLFQPSQSDQYAVVPQVTQYDAVQGYNFGQLPDQWQQPAAALTTGEDNLQTQTYAEFYGSGQDPPSGSNNFSFQSGLSSISTPSSSPTPLHSACNVVYGGGGAVEDDREISYGSNVLDFEIPDILDVVNDFM